MNNENKQKIRECGEKIRDFYKNMMCMEVSIKNVPRIINLLVDYPEKVTAKEVREMHNQIELDFKEGRMKSCEENIYLGDIIPRIKKIKKILLESHSADIMD